MDPVTRSETLRVGDLNLHYLTAGEGPAVLLLHGWPTSSFLWRNTLGPLARSHRVLALDLPGFGRSDKPLDVSYSFRFYERTLNGFLDALSISDVGLAVHDLGGPIGLYWALRNPSRVRGLALLNTVVYPVPSWAVVAFALATWVPGLRSYLTSPGGLEFALKLGLGDPSFATPEAIRGVQAPFESADARKALLKTIHALHPGGFLEIAKKFAQYRGPLRVIYGAKDRILPDVAKTMARVAREHPRAEVTCFRESGHFLQEERGAEIGELLNDFFAKGDASHG